LLENALLRARLVKF